jgi:hypothetical protein
MSWYNLSPGFIALILVLLLGTLFCFAFPIAHALHGGIVLAIFLHPITLAVLIAFSLSQ